MFESKVLTFINAIRNYSAEVTEYKSILCREAVCRVSAEGHIHKEYRRLGGRDESRSTVIANYIGNHPPLD